MPTSNLRKEWFLFVGTVLIVVCLATIIFYLEGLRVTSIFLSLISSLLVGAVTTQKAKRFLININRAELAWIFVLLASMSIDSLSVDEVLSGTLRSAHFIRLLCLLFALVLLLPNIFYIRRVFISTIFSGKLTKLFTIYLIFAFSSALWSVSPIITLGKSFEISVALLIILLVAAKKNGKAKLERLFILTLAFIGILLTTIFFGHLFYPATFRTYLYLKEGYIISSGVLPISSNAISRFGALICVVTISVLFTHRYTFNDRIFLIAVIIFSGFFPFFAEGRTGITSLLISFLILIITQKKFWFFFLAPFVFFIILKNFEQLSNFFLRGQTRDLFIGLSGRADWWIKGIDVFFQKPIFGYGFGVGGRVTFQQIDNVFASGIHNGFLEVALGVGFVGFSIWVIVFLFYFYYSFSNFLLGKDIHLHSTSISIGFATFLSSGAGGWMSPELGLFLIVIKILDVDMASKTEKKNVRYPGSSMS